MKDPAAVFDSYVNDLRNSEIAEFIKLNYLPKLFERIKNGLNVFLARLNKIKSIIDKNE